MPAAAQNMNIVIVGHVDHGKSTLVGRLLADTGSLPQGKLEQVREACRRTAKPFEYAFLLDALKDEQSQGITIDTARTFFKSAARDYIIIDAPGHIEFLKNMVSGAARAEAALLVIDAEEGIQENSKRHGYLLSMLGIRQVAVCVNKMDLVGYRQDVFEGIERDYRAFLKETGLKPRAFLPLAAREGENLTARSSKMSWYSGPSVLEALDAFETAPSIEDKPFRMPVQGVYKFTEEGDSRRIVAGRVESGSLAVGDEVVFLPSNKRSTVKTIEMFNAPQPLRVSAGQSAGITLAEQIYINRGDVMCKSAEPPAAVGTVLNVQIFWMGKRPMVLDRPYKIKIATAQAPVRLKQIVRVIDASSLSQLSTREIGRHDVARCVLKVDSPVAVDLVNDLEATGRFVIVDEYDIAGGGIIDGVSGTGLAAVPQAPRVDVSRVDRQRRATAYGHRAAFVLLTGRVGADKKTIAKEVEHLLFERGCKTHMLGMGDALRSLDADVEQQRLERHEQVRKMGEAAHLFLEAGMIVVATASNVNDAELAELHQAASREDTIVVNIGPKQVQRASVDAELDAAAPPADNAARIVELLRSRGVIR